MCFGNNQTTQTQTSVATPSPAVASAANQNLQFAQNLENTPFSAYTGGFSPQQQASFTGATNIAGAVAPTLPGAAAGLTNYMAGAQNQPTVTPETISSQMSPYMNQYVSQALQPQIANLNNQEALQSQLTQGQATSAGAFGDPRATMLQQNQNAADSLQEQGLVGNAYNAAFNTAIGAGAQDVSNNLQGQITNAGLYNTGLGEQLTGATTALGANTGATTLENEFGGQQTAQTYNNYLMQQQYPFQQAQLLNQSEAAGAAALPANTVATTQAPNNAGYGILGSLLGAGGQAASGYFAGQGTAAAGAAIAAALAKGGPADKGKTYVVGEKGPELFVPKTSGTVIPYEKLKAAIEKKHGVSTAGLSRALGIAA
jgi:hypothetical protein